VFGGQPQATQRNHGSARKALVKKQHQRAFTGGRILLSR
jgi:hypothetical protein